MPVIDPSLFIHRFCSKLEFGEALPQVSMTALRLLQRMKRDWMCHGRRPTGLVGAAILIAARYHGFKRTTNQIVHTVHVCDETIRKRLFEFKQTPIARLTREEFEKIDLENDIKEECDPPSFKKSMRTNEILRLANIEKEMVKRAKIIESEISEPQGGRADDQSTTLGVQSNNEDGANSEVTSTALVPVKEENITQKDEEEIDDEEIEGYLLTKEESQVKSIIWHQMHKDWLEEQEIKKKKKNKNNSGVKRRKKNKECKLSE